MGGGCDYNASTQEVEARGSGIKGPSTFSLVTATPLPVGVLGPGDFTPCLILVYCFISREDSTIILWDAHPCQQCLAAPKEDGISKSADNWPFCQAPLCSNSHSDTVRQRHNTAEAPSRDNQAPVLQVWLPENHEGSSLL